MKPGLYTNDKGTSVVIATYVTPNDFVEYHHVKPDIVSNHWGLPAHEFLEKWPWRLEKVKLPTGTRSPGTTVSRGLYTDGVRVAWVWCVDETLRSAAGRVHYELVPPFGRSFMDGEVCGSTSIFLEFFPYRVTSFEVR